MDKLQETPERLEAMELVNRARLLMDAGNTKDAGPLLDEAIQADPMYLRCYVEQGNLHMLQEDYPRALESYQNGLLVDKNSGELYFHIGNAKLLQEKYDEAVVAFGHAEELGFGEAELPLNLAFCYEQMGQTGAALSAYLRACRLAPDDPTPWLRRIQLQTSSGSLDNALNAAQEFIKRFPGIQEGYEAITDILVTQREFDKADVFLTSALEAFPSAPVLLMELARIRAIQDRYDEALAMLREAQAQPDLTERMRFRLDDMQAHILQLNGDIDGALAVYDRMIAQEGDRVDVATRMTRMNLLSATKHFERLLTDARETKKLPEVEGQLCMALAMEPWALENLGRIAEAKELYEEAARHLRLIGIRDTSRADTYMYRSLCYRGLGRYDEALKQLEVYTGMGIDNAMLCLYRAKIYEEMGNSEKAEAEKARALKLQERSGAAR